MHRVSKTVNRSPEKNLTIICYTSAMTVKTKKEEPEANLEKHLSQLQEQIELLTDKMDESKNEIKVVKDEKKAVKEMTNNEPTTRQLSVL